MLDWLDRFLGDLLAQRKDLTDPGWGERPSELLRTLWDGLSYNGFGDELKLAAEVGAVTLVFVVLIRWFERMMLGNKPKEGQVMNEFNHTGLLQQTVARETSRLCSENINRINKNKNREEQEMEKNEEWTTQESPAEKRERRNSFEEKALLWGLGGLLLLLLIGGVYQTGRWMIYAACKDAVMAERQRLGGDTKWLGFPVSVVDTKLQAVTDVQLGVRADGVMVWRYVEPPFPK